MWVNTERKKKRKRNNEGREREREVEGIALPYRRIPINTDRRNKGNRKSPLNKHHSNICCIYPSVYMLSKPSAKMSE